MEFVQGSRLKGDYLEFGCYEGKSLISAFHFAQARGLKHMRFYAFDSFEGLPEIKGIDEVKDIDNYFTKGLYACDVNKFKNNLKRGGVDLNKVEIVPGWYDDVLNEETKKKLPINKAAVIWIDCDLYESTVPILNFITDYLQDGTILIFDDWFCFRGNPDKGEQKAFREWLEKNLSIKATEFHKFGWNGNSFIFNLQE